MVRVTPTMATIKARMTKSRKNALEYALTYSDNKLMRFCNDDTAFNWACRFYRYQSDAFYGNMPDIDSYYFKSTLWMITDNENYKYMTNQLKEDLKGGYEIKEATYLLDTAVDLRKKYKR